jgi:LacI family transcriptional regulator
VAGIKDVARLAGVSVGTVSNVLNRPGSVSPVLRERVEGAIDELGFVRNESARQLRAGVSRTIAAVVLDVANPFFTDVLAGAELAAEGGDALVVVCNSGGDPGRESRHLARLAEQRVMGVLLTPVLDELNPLACRLQDSGTPVVLLDRVSLQAQLPSVAVDDLRGGTLVGEHLVDRGHRDVVFLGGPLGLRQVRERIEGVRAARGGALRVETVESAGMSVRAGAQTAASVLAGLGSRPVVGRPTALFCANDLLALGALNECLRRGVRVPEDLALVGYDDIEFASTAPVPLTSVRQPREQLGRMAVELLMEQAVRGGPPGGNRQLVFQPDLVVRESSVPGLPVRTLLDTRTRNPSGGAAP